MEESNSTISGEVNGEVNNSDLINNSINFISNNNSNAEKSFLESGEDKIDKIAAELGINLPKDFLPFPMRIVILLMLVGGLGILGSVFTDFLSPKQGGIFLQLIRLLTGLAFLTVAYGIHSRERWAAWLYGGIVLIGLITNFLFALVPSLLVIYFYINRNYLKSCYLDYIAVSLYDKTSLFIKNHFYKRV